MYCEKYHNVITPLAADPHYISSLKPILFMARDSFTGFLQVYHTSVDNRRRVFCPTLLQKPLGMPTHLRLSSHTATPEWTWERWQRRGTPYSSNSRTAGTSSSDCLVPYTGHSYTGHSLVGGLTPLLRGSQCILQPQPTGQFTELNVKQFYFR